MLVKVRKEGMTQVRLSICIFTAADANTCTSLSPARWSGPDAVA